MNWRARELRLAVLGVLLLWVLLAVLAHDAYGRRPAIGAEDEGALLGGREALAVERAQAVHATAFRVIVRGTRGLGAYDAGVFAVCAAGFRIQVALTDYRGEGFVKAALGRWGWCVHTWSLWNEPELSIGLRRYGVLHRRGFRLIRRVAPLDRVLIGEVSPHVTLRGLRRLDHLPGAGLALHPYQFGASPRVDPLAVAHPTGRWPAGVGSIRTIARHTHHALYVTEFGYGAREQGWWPAALRIMAHVHVREVVAYQLATEAEGRWDTSLFGRGGAPRSGATFLSGLR